MFTIDAFYKNNDTYTATQQLMRWHFQINYKVQCHQLIASKPESTDLALKRPPGKVIHTLENIESGIGIESIKFYVGSYSYIKHLRHNFMNKFYVKFNCHPEKVQVVQELDKFDLISHTKMCCNFLTCADEDVYEGQSLLSPIWIQE